ncbi:MAG: ABC transporter ATP-binding protein [Patescibacteria group bacterium]|nr:MAG: ABC transporter ATP-binding protein [Patescibacteria group bacterium]
MKVLDLRKVVKVYGEGRTAVKAVDRVDLTVGAGEVVLVMGPSGSGKTTLLSMAGGILKPTSGEVFLNGEEITGLSERELPKIRLKDVGFIFQTFNLLANLSALENVALAASLSGFDQRKSRGKAQAILSDLDLGERLNHLPKDLSGGEKQRVSVARALVNDPKIILADEPTANLDSKAGHSVANLLRDVAKSRNKAVVVVSHDQRIRNIADRVLWLEDGRFKELAKMVPDPTCGMPVEKTPEAPHTTVGGKTYYFCSIGCKKEFLRKHPSAVPASP